MEVFLGDILFLAKTPNILFFKYTQRTKTECNGHKMKLNLISVVILFRKNLLFVKCKSGFIGHLGQNLKQ